MSKIRQISKFFLSFQVYFDPDAVPGHHEVAPFADGPGPERAGGGPQKHFRNQFCFRSQTSLYHRFNDLSAETQSL
jgi:hypothetical protein